MSDEVWILLIGAGVGLVASIVGAVVNHFLSLRAEKKKREWDRKEKEAEDLRSCWLLPRCIDTGECTRS